MKCKLFVLGMIIFFNLPLKAQNLDRNQKMRGLITQNFAFALIVQYLKVLYINL